jgi:xylulokinase
MAYIGLDVGTTGAKATVVDPSGEILSGAYYEYNLRFPAPNRVEIRAGDVWAAARAALSAAKAGAGRAIEAIAVASFGEAAVLLGRDGEPVCDSIFYTDARGNDMLPELEARVDRDALQLRTGMPVNGMFTLPKLMWLQKNTPEVLDKTEKLLLFGSYIEYMLCGQAATDSSLASRTLLFDKRNLCWDRVTLDAFGINPAWLPPYVPAGAVVARMTETVARELNMPGRPVIVSGVHDQIGAALGAGALAAGDVADGIGSAECLCAVLPQDIDHGTLFRNNICAEPHAVNGLSVALAFNNTAGAALKWYRDTFEQELRAQCQKDGTSAYHALNSRLGDEPSPLLFLPHLAGTGTPYMDAEASGMVCGLTLRTGRDDLYRAILEGMNYEMRYNLELLARSGLARGTLTAVGGGASPEALRVKADILNYPIRMLRTPQSGTMGMAMLCALALGRCKNLAEAAEVMVRATGIIEPRPQYRDQYDEKYGQYLRMYRAVREIYGR